MQLALIWGDTSSVDLAVGLVTSHDNPRGDGVLAKDTRWTLGPTHPGLKRRLSVSTLTPDLSEISGSS